MSVSFAVAALAGLTANAVFKKLKCPDCLVCCSQVYCLDILSEHFSSAALRGGRFPMINVRAGLIIATRRAFAAAELVLCIRVMAQEVLFP